MFSTLEKIMNNMSRSGARHLLACIMAVLLSYGSLAIAASTAPSSPPDSVLDYPGGLACSFALSIEIWDGKQHNNVFKDKNGFVRSITAGTGSALRFTNPANGKTLFTKSDGAVNHITTYTLDGSFTETNTGHTVLILFPTDTPPGPSTTLYVGKVVFTSDADFNFNLISESENKTDICAALS